MKSRSIRSRETGAVRGMSANLPGEVRWYLLPVRRSINFREQGSELNFKTGCFIRFPGIFR